MPTRWYAMFARVQELGGKTVGEYLTGRPLPVMGLEDYLWNRFALATERLRQQRERSRGKK